MTGDDTPPISGEIVGPEGDGQWLSVPDAHRVTGIAQKTLYRHVEHNQIPSRKNARGRIEVWIADAPAPTTIAPRQSQTVAIDTIQVRELLAPLAQALTDSQRQSQANLERAMVAEAEVKRLNERLSRSHPQRLDTLKHWWRFWILGETDDSL